MINESQEEYKKYHSYLLKRSTLGHLYRQNILYPKLSRYLQGSVLDIGCGIGDFCSFRSQTTGIDINPFNINFCREKNLDCHLSKINEPFPIEGSRFDGAILDNVLEHMNDPELILKEANRVLKLNGIFIVGVPGKKGFDSDADHVIFYDQKLLVDTISQYGFAHKKTLMTPLPFNFLSHFLKQFCYYGIFVKTLNH